MRTLVIVGNSDWLCTAPGMLYFSDYVKWEGSAAFRAEKMQPLIWHDVPAWQSPVTWGWTKSAGLLTHVEIDQAGHMAPRDRPREVLETVSKWIF